jgi:hypothetical protein
MTRQARHLTEQPEGQDQLEPEPQREAVRMRSRKKERLNKKKETVLSVGRYSVGAIYIRAIRPRAGISRFPTPWFPIWPKPRSGK